MFHKHQPTKIRMDGETIAISNVFLNFSFQFSDINYLYINTEIDETAREMTVSLKKLKRTEPELTDLLRMNLTVGGISFSFTVERTEGEPFAAFVEEDFRQKLLRSTVLSSPGGIGDDLREKLLADDPKDVVYPIYFHACGFDDEMGAEA